MAAKKAETDKRRYLVQQSQGEFVIELDAKWKVTFGYVNPAVPERGTSGSAHCLRAYEGTKLRGVWANVTGFRDLSIPLARKVQRETGSAQWTSDSEGNFDRAEKRNVETDEFVLEAGADGVPF